MPLCIPYLADMILFWLSWSSEISREFSFLGLVLCFARQVLLQVRYLKKKKEFKSKYDCKHRIQLPVRYGVRIQTNCGMCRLKKRKISAQRFKSRLRFAFAAGRVPLRCLITSFLTLGPAIFAAKIHST